MLRGRLSRSRRVRWLRDLVIVTVPLAAFATAHAGWAPHAVEQTAMFTLFAMGAAAWLVGRWPPPDRTAADTPAEAHADKAATAASPTGDDADPRVHAAFEAVGVPLLLFSVEGECEFANAAARRALHLGPSSPLPTTGWPGYRIFRADGETPVEGGDLPVVRAAAGEAVDTEVVMTAGGDRPLRLLIQSRPLRGTGGEVRAVVLTAVDVTAMHEQHRLAARQTAQFTAIAEASRAVLRERDARAAICRAAVTVSGAAMASLFEPDEAGGLMCTACDGGDAVGVQVPTDASSMLATSFASARTLTLQDVTDDPRISPALTAVWARSHDASLVSAAWVPVVDRGRCVGVLTAAFDRPVTDWTTTVQALEVLAGEAAVAIERQDLLRRLSAEAWTDGLTGAANRRAWDASLDDRLQQARTGRTPLSVVLVDLDHFKHYNDRHGHLAGDDLLRAAVAAWRRRLRPGDLLCRWGGEEFAVLLPGCTLTGAQALAGDLRRLMPDGQTVSAGVAAWNGVEDAESLVARADAALYAAKDAGRDRVVADATQ